MTPWPNWVDLVIVTVVLRACYTGFGRGLLTELINLAGVVSITAVAINCWQPVAQWLRPWVWFSAATGDAVAFWLLFLVVIFILRVVMARVGEVIRWERLHWTIQGLGLLVGGVRGLWWAGVVLVLLTSSGFLYLHDSVESRSILGPRLHATAKPIISRVADRFPGAQLQGPTLVPGLRPSGRRTAPAKPEPKSAYDPW